MSRPNILRAGLFVAIVALAHAAGAQSPQPAALTMRQLSADVWVGLGGAGGNSTVIIGRTGVIVVDAKTTERGAKELLTEVAKIIPKPVTTVIVTHSDGDHVNGVAAFPPNIRIIAHEGNKKELERALVAGGRGAPPADRLPNQVVTQEKKAMTIDGVKLELYHWAPAHTSGDLVVYLPERKTVITRRHGDLSRRGQPEHSSRKERLISWLADYGQGHPLARRHDVCSRTWRASHAGSNPKKAGGNNGAARQDRSDG
jgi:hypothetical protein